MHLVRNLIKTKFGYWCAWNWFLWLCIFCWLTQILARTFSQIKQLSEFSVVSALLCSERRSGEVYWTPELFNTITLRQVLGSFQYWVSKVIQDYISFCFTSLCDWSRKLHSQPIRCKTLSSLKVFSFPLIGRCDYFGFTTLKKQKSTPL